MNYLLFFVVTTFVVPASGFLGLNDKINYTNESFFKPIKVVNEETLVKKGVEGDEKLVVAYIEKYSAQYGVDPQLALNIAWCESRYYNFAKNDHSTAEGVFQFIDSTWLNTMEKMEKATSTSKNKIPISIEAGVFLLAEEGACHWEASKECWGNM